MDGGNILIADDDRDFLDYIERILHQACPSLRADMVQTPAQCTSAFSNKDYDAVLIDFYLGNRTADEIVTELKSAQPKCCFITMSGSSRQEVAISSLKHGSEDFLHKDDAVNPEKLGNCIIQSIEKQRKRNMDQRKTQRRITNLEDMAYRDGLTGLANRRAADELLKHNGRQVMDRRGMIAAIMIDIDHFKDVNDTFGHASGDQVLKELAGIIRDVMASDDDAFRWGGEEFFVLSFDTNATCAIHLAERIRERVSAQQFKFGEHTHKCTISAGIFIEQATAFRESSIEKADQALYFAKEHGRNRVCQWSQAEFCRTLKECRVNNPDASLKSTVFHFAKHLGPTQFEHITSHSFAVAELAMTIGVSMGLPKDDLLHIKDAGKYHDIGKVFVPEVILAKPASLSPAEHDVVDRHAADGAEFARIAGFDEFTCSAIRGHHQRYESLNGDISDKKNLGAQILQVADALTTMTTCRPYRASRCISKALEVLRDERSRQFCPEVVDATLATFN